MAFVAGLVVGLVPFVLIAYALQRLGLTLLIQILVGAVFWTGWVLLVAGVT